jgi:hypothetical protein
MMRSRDLAFSRRSFTAAYDPVNVCCPSHTSPVAPEPSRRSSLYSPTRGGTGAAEFMAPL